MNQQKTKKGRGIEWLSVPDRIPVTWNPVGGCSQGCVWDMPDGTRAQCYAKTVAEGVARSAYPNGFAHHYFRPDILQEPLRAKEQHAIFLDSMSDLMGVQVPEGDILQVLDVVKRTPQHLYFLLTKNAPRLLKFADYLPDNLWVGVSMPPSEMYGKPLIIDQQYAYMRTALRVLNKLKSPVRWISFEPLSFDVAQTLAAFGMNNANLPIEWAVIGAASRGRSYYQPDKKHVYNLLTRLDNWNVPVFFKGNLDWPKDQWRENFPIIGK